jgi:RNA polymerase sigma factor (TIGR02999 family)
MSTSERVYRRLEVVAHARMARERRDHLLESSALVHEALLKLSHDGKIRLDDRPEFFRAAVVAMRQILVDHARAAGRQKRGGEAIHRVDLDAVELDAHVPFDGEGWLVVEETMTRLGHQNPAAAEVVRLRVFEGRTMEEAAERAGVSLRRAERLWTYARAWLWRELSGGEA